MHANNEIGTLNPIRAIGQLFRGEDDDDQVVTIDPVAFEPGSAALTPDARRQVQRVADFLRASPYIRVQAAAAISQEDRTAGRAQRITGRIQQIQRREGIEDFDEAAREVFRRHFPAQPPPRTADEIIAVLANALPQPDPGLQRLAARRVALVRAALIDAAGVAPARVVKRDEPATLGAEQGRVQFELMPAS